MSGQATVLAQAAGFIEYFADRPADMRNPVLNDAEALMRGLLAQRDALFTALGDLVDALDPLHMTINQCRALDAAVVALAAAEAK